MLQLFSLALLCLGVMLEVSGAGFWGLDLLIGLCMGSSVVAAAASVLAGKSMVWGLLIAAMGSLALALHLCLNLGVLG